MPDRPLGTDPVTSEREAERLSPAPPVPAAGAHPSPGLRRLLRMLALRLR